MVSTTSVEPFSTLVGQSQAIALLTRIVEQQRIAPGYLFVGPDGTGKALAALCFSQLLLHAANRPTSEAESAILARRIHDRNHPDLLWVEPTYLHQGKLLTAAEAEATGLKRKSPPRIRLPQIRDIARFLSRPPLESPRAVVVIEQAERMAEAAANALLKTLEEPGQATLLLLAPDQQALLPTLISRCQTIPFRRLSPVDMAQVLQQVGQSEILEAPEVMAIAQGSPGKALESWGQLQALQAQAPELLHQLERPPSTLRGVLEAARNISKALDTEAQLWLLDYLQHRYWQQGVLDSGGLAHLEEARRYLLAFVQPRLVWEVTLSNLNHTELV